MKEMAKGGGGGGTSTFLTVAGALSATVTAATVAAYVYKYVSLFIPDVFNVFTLFSCPPNRHRERLAPYG